MWQDRFYDPVQHALKQVKNRHLFAFRECSTVIYLVLKRRKLGYKLHARKRTMEKKKERQKELETARTHVKVYLSPDEKAVIKKKADAFGMTISNYLKTVGCGYEPLDKLSFKKVDDLLKVAGTVGKFTGLLKIFLREQNTHRIETSRKQIEKDYREAVKCVADIKAKVKHVCEFDEPEDIE